MKHNSFLISCLLLVVTTLSISCGKEGPAGPAGAQGTAGPAGTPGVAGPTGPAGTANVIYSAWLDVAYSRDANDTLTYFVDIPAAKIDMNMLSRGEMKVYMNWGTAADPDVAPIPFNQGALYINVDFFLGIIELYSNANPSTVTNANGKFRQIRYVLIPGGTPASIKGIDWSDYKKVQAGLGIHD